MKAVELYALNMFLRLKPIFPDYLHKVLFKHCLDTWAPLCWASESDTARVAFYTMEAKVLSQPGQILIPVLLPDGSAADGTAQVMQLLPYDVNDSVEVLEDRLKRVRALFGGNNDNDQDCDGLQEADDQVTTTTPASPPPPPEVTDQEREKSS